MGLHVLLQKLKFLSDVVTSEVGMQALNQLTQTQVAGGP